MNTSNENFMKILETLGKAITDKDLDIYYKQSVIDALTKELQDLKAKVEELEKIDHPAKNAMQELLRKEG